MFKKVAGGTLQMENPWHNGIVERAARVNLKGQDFSFVRREEIAVTASMDLKEIGWEILSFFLGVHWRMDSRGIGLGGWRAVYL